MARGGRLTQRAMRLAIDGTYGNISAMAVALNVSRQTIYNYLEKHGDLKEYLDKVRTEATEMIDEMRNHIVDMAERALYRDILDPVDERVHQNAYLFVLKTMGKDRGWGQNLDVTSGGDSMKMFVGVSPDDWDNENS